MTIIKNSIYANLKFVDEGKDEKERIARFAIISCKEIKTILDYTFNPKILWLLDKNIKYKPSKDEAVSLYMNLFREIKKLNIFLNYGPYPTLTVKKRTSIFIDICQNVHPDDAKLLMSMKDKVLPFKNITPELVKKAFPNGFVKYW